MSISWRRATFVLVKVGVIAGLFAYLLASGRLDFSHLLPACGHPFSLAAGLLMVGVTPVLGSVRWFLLLRAQGSLVDLRSCVRMQYAAGLFDLVLIGSSGGDPIKAALVAASTPKGARIEAGTTVFFDRFVGLCGLFLLTVVAMAVNLDRMAADAKLRPLLLSVAIAAVAFVAGIALAFSASARERLIRPLGGRLPGGAVLLRVYEGVHLYRGHPGTLAAAVALSVAAHLASFLAIYLLAVAMEMPVAFWPFLMLIPLCLALNALGPAGGWGVGEAAFEGIFKWALDVAGGAMLGFGWHVAWTVSRLPGIYFALRLKWDGPAETTPATPSAPADPVAPPNSEDAARG